MMCWYNVVTHNLSFVCVDRVIMLDLWLPPVAMTMMMYMTTMTMMRKASPQHPHNQVVNETYKSHV